MGHFLTRGISATALAAVLSLPAAAATSTWQIDPNHSAAQFAVRHLAISTVRGAFTKVSGTIQFDDKDIAKSSVDVTIAPLPWIRAWKAGTRICAAITFSMLKSTPR